MGGRAETGPRARSVRDLRVTRRQLLCKFTRARQPTEALGDELIALWGRVLIDQCCSWAHVARSGHQLGQRGTSARHQREVQVPQVVEVDLDFALCGVPSESILALSTLGVSRTRQQRSSLRKGIERIISEKSPTRIVVHGIDRDDIFGGFRESTHFDFHTPRIHEVYSNARPSNG